jgi:DNA-binding NarL/FixJ family response regulator
MGAVDFSPGSTAPLFIGGMMSDNVTWGKIIAVLLTQGWRPPDPDAQAVERILDDVLNTHPLLTLKLSQRQTEIMYLTALGYTNPVIAAKLFISQETVKSHKKIVASKLGVSNSTHAVYILTKQGLL